MEYKGESFLTDNDLDVINLGRFPEVFITNDELREAFEKEYGRSFLGGDEIISYRQALVGRGMKFEDLEQEILKKVKAKGISDLSNNVFDRMSTGIGSGHSMGGLSGVVFGLNGTKMIDSGLTGLVSSRSLVTSGRRRVVKVSDIVVPENIARREDLLEEYLTISRDAFSTSKQFKEQFGKNEGTEAFNKALPYNNPADLFIVLPLDTMATLHFEVEADKLNPRGPFIPREIHTLVSMFPEIAEENGIGIMYKQRIQVPRDGYLHYNVFKDPQAPNYALEKAIQHGMPTEPVLLSSNIDLTPGFEDELENLKGLIEKTRKITDPKDLVEAALKCMFATREITEEYNSSVRALISDQLSFRVWSEQKRHATLKQHVESIYSAAIRSAEAVKDIWPQIEEVYKNGKSGNLPINRLEKIIVIDKRLKEQPELLTAYAYHSGRQLMFFDKLVGEGISLRDAAYTIPRNVLTRNVEDYDLINMIDLELPLRLCKKCEPERHMTSWKKRKLLADGFPMLSYFLKPKCGVGYCTEDEFCNHIFSMREYDQDLHKAAKEELLKRAR
jgi:hypothetical protein